MLFVLVPEHLNTIFEVKTGMTIYEGQILFEQWQLHVCAQMYVYTYEQTLGINVLYSGMWWGTDLNSKKYIYN